MSGRRRAYKHAFSYKFVVRVAGCIGEYVFVFLFLLTFALGGNVTVVMRCDTELLTFEAQGRREQLLQIDFFEEAATCGTEREQDATK